MGLRQLEFDDPALWAAVDEGCSAAGMTLSQLNRAIGWSSLPTVTRMRERGSSGCHAVLPFIQWLERTPESFAIGADSEGELLPDPGAGRWRWYWDMLELRASLDAQRIDRGMTWPEVAAQLGVASDELAHLRRTRYGTSMTLAMRAASWLGRSAASFMWEHDGLGLPWSPRRVE